MRALVLTNMYPRADRPTFGIFVKEQVEDLERLGCTVDLRVIRGDASKLNYGRAAASLRRIVRRGAYDVLHAHYGLTGAVAVAQRQLPVVVTFHGSDCNGEVPWQTAVSWAVSRVSHPVFVSPLLADGLGLRDAPVIPAAVDADRFAPIPQTEARTRLGLSTTGVYVLLPGSRRELRKRADLFDDTLEHARARVPSIEGLSMENLSRDDVALTMNAVDAVLMTSNYEGSPVAIKEALACCTPVVSVPVADVPGLIAGLPGCGVAPRDGRQLAERLVEAIDVGRSAELRERVLPFSREPMAAAVMRVFEDAVGGRG